MIIWGSVRLCNVNIWLLFFLKRYRLWNELRELVEIAHMEYGELHVMGYECFQSMGSKQALILMSDLLIESKAHIFMSHLGALHISNGLLDLLLPIFL